MSNEGSKAVPSFSSDWFGVWIPVWEKHVVPRLAGRPDTRWLEVGSYEGRSALWTLDNVLTGARSTLTCVDAWYDSYEPRFDLNLKGRENVIKAKGLFHEVMPILLKGGVGTFDGAYLDGNHNEFNTRVCTEAIWKLLKPGAVMVFDDYGSSVYPSVTRVVDEFLGRSETKHEQIFRGPPYNTQETWQVIVVKTAD